MTAARLSFCDAALDDRTFRLAGVATLDSSTAESAFRMDQIPAAQAAALQSATTPSRDNGLTLKEDGTS
jgi:hypothetical protein